MANFTQAEENLLRYVQDDRLRTSLGMIREVSEDIWGIDAPRLVRDFTDHGIGHSERIVAFIERLLAANDGKPPTSNEMYLLLAGVYLHDIGMQCDPLSMPLVKSRAIELGADLSEQLTGPRTSGYPIEEQKAIRRNHHYLTAAWIDHACRTGQTVLGPAMGTVPDELVDDLMDVCMHHARLPITDCPVSFKFDPTGRKQFVAAILRLAE